MKLFEIVDMYRADVARLQDLDLPPEVVLDTIDSMQGEITDKIRAVVYVGKEMKLGGQSRVAAGEKLMEAALAMVDSGKAEINRADGLFSYAQIAIQNSGLTLPIRYTEFTVNLQKNPPSCTVKNEDLLPPHLKRITVTYSVGGEHKKLLEAVQRAFAAGQMAGCSVSEPAISVQADKRAVLDALKQIAAANDAKPIGQPHDHMAGAHMNATVYRLTVK